MEGKVRSLFEMIVSRDYQPECPPTWSRISPSPWTGSGGWRLRWRDRREDKAMSLDFGSSGGSAEFPNDIVILGISEIEYPSESLEFAICNWRGNG